jgi:hypothetical protein
MRKVGWLADRFAATSFEDATRSVSTFVTDDSDALISSPFVEIIIDATGNTGVGSCRASGKPQGAQGGIGQAGTTAEQRPLNTRKLWPTADLSA